MFFYFNFKRMNDIDGNKAKSNNLLFPNQNSYMNNINKNIIPINESIRIQNKMNISPFKPKEKNHKSEINFKVVRILLLVIFIVAILSFIILYTIEKPKNENKIIVFYTKEGFIDPEIFCQNKKSIICKYFYDINNLRRIEEYNSTTNNLVKVEMTINYKLSNLSSMFKQHYNLISADLSIKSPIINDISHTFESCSNLTYIDFSSFIGQKIKSMNSLFKECYNLTNITGLEKLDTSSLDDIEGMFVDCKNITEVDLSSFNLSKITHKNIIFDNNESLKKVKLNNETKKEIINQIFNKTYFSNKNNNILIEINDQSKKLEEYIENSNKLDDDMNSNYITTISTNNLKTIPKTSIPKSSTTIIKTIQKPLTTNITITSTNNMKNNPTNNIITFPTTGKNQKTIITNNSTNIISFIPTSIQTTFISTIPTTIITTNSTINISSIPTTIISSFPKIIISSIPSTIISSIPKTIISSIPTSILTTFISTIPTTIISSIPTSIITNNTNIMISCIISSISKTINTTIITTIITTNRSNIISSYQNIIISTNQKTSFLAIENKSNNE